MTLKVTISVDANQAWAARVVPLQVDSRGGPFITPAAYDSAPIVQPGQSVDVYIHSGAALHVHEVAMEPKEKAA